MPVIEPPVEARTYRQLFDRETLADYLRLSTDTIDRLVKAKKLSCVRIGNQVQARARHLSAHPTDPVGRLLFNVLAMSPSSKPA